MLLSTLEKIYEKNNIVKTASEKYTKKQFLNQLSRCLSLFTQMQRLTSFSALTITNARTQPPRSCSAAQVRSLMLSKKGKKKHSTGA
jgi:hypothetical protein